MARQPQSESSGLISTALNSIPAVNWLRDYHRGTLARDSIAAVIVTFLLIPQSLAYAMLAGLPPELGLYASVFPLVAYALLGSSRTLSVGPVAVVSLLTATSIHGVVEQGIAGYVPAAITLALLSGVFLLAMGVLRLGFMANFLSHAVISGFITASGILIAISQLKYILGITAQGDTLPELSQSLISNLGQVNTLTVALGGGVIIFLYLSRTYAQGWLVAIGVTPNRSQLIARSAPVLAVFATVAAAYIGEFDSKGLAVIGHIPPGLPGLIWDSPDWATVQVLLVPALMISIIGYVESVSVGMTLGAKRRQVINPNQELVGLGAANISSALSGAFPVTGGFSRSVVNFDAGAETQMASILAAGGIALASMFLTPFLFYLPTATLAATIIVAVLSLIDFSILSKTWQFSKSDFWAVLITLVITLLQGVEVGVISGVSASLLLFIYRSAKPHIAEVGLVPGTEHFRNVERYEVVILPSLFMLRLDESLFFGNAQALKETIDQAVYKRDNIANVVLQCSAINSIDFSALETLERINEQLRDQGVLLHLAEVKGPVMDALERSSFFSHLSGEVFLSLYDAYQYFKSSSGHD